MYCLLIWIRDKAKEMWGGRIEIIALLVHFLKTHNKGCARLKQGAVTSTSIFYVEGGHPGHGAMNPASLMGISRELQSEVEVGLEPKHFVKGCEHPRWCYNSRPIQKCPYYLKKIHCFFLHWTMNFIFSVVIRARREPGHLITKIKGYLNEWIMARLSED